VGQLLGACGGDDLVAHYTDFAPIRRQPKHRFDEIPRLTAAARETVQPAGSNQEIPVEQRLDEIFPRELRGRVAAQRPGTIDLSVRARLPAVENIIGAKVNQNGPNLSGGNGKVPDRDGVHGECPLGLVLALIDPMIGGGIQNQAWSVLDESFPYLHRVCQLQISMRQGHQITIAERLPKLAPQLAVGADQERTHSSLVIVQKSLRIDNQT